MYVVYVRSAIDTRCRQRRSSSCYPSRSPKTTDEVRHAARCDAGRLPVLCRPDSCLDQQGLCHWPSSILDCSSQIFNIQQHRRGRLTTRAGFGCGEFIRSWTFSLSLFILRSCSAISGILPRGPRTKCPARPALDAPQPPLGRPPLATKGVAASSKPRDTPIRDSETRATR